MTAASAVFHRGIYDVSDCCLLCNDIFRVVLRVCKRDRVVFVDKLGVRGIIGAFAMSAGDHAVYDGKIAETLDRYIVSSTL